MRADYLPSEAARFEEVCRFGRDRLEPLARTVALAFADDPMWKWIYDRGEPVAVADGLAMARWLLAAMSPADEIHGFRHHDALALWSAPRTPENEQIVADHAETLGPFGAALAELLGERLLITATLSEAMAEHRPVEPHWYLGVLGTHPDRQSKGLGGRLLATMHARCDRLGLPSFLESSNPQNYGFYERHGYIETAIYGALDSPPLRAMRRDPR